MSSTLTTELLKAFYTETSCTPLMSLRAGNAIDGQTANYWHTQWGSASPNHPHCLIVDLGKSETIGGFRYTPRQGDANVGGRIKDYRIYVGDKLKPR